MTFLDNENSFLITSTYGISDNFEKSASKVYSIQNGKLVNYFQNTVNNSVYYLLYWFNKKNRNHYVIISLFKNNY